MYKFLKIIPVFVALTILFGVAISARAQMAQPSIPGQFVLQQSQDAAKNNPGALTVGNIVTGIGGQFASWVSLKVIGYVMFVGSYIAGYIGSIVFTLAGLLVEFGLLLNTTILDSDVVQLGWRFCRDLANLGFTIGIVVIAYATMLGIESYGIKNLIRNFIIAAVMVNFSFSIAGFAIDISNMLTHFFVTASIGGGVGDVGFTTTIHKFTETLASAFNPQKLLATKTSNLEVYQSLSSNDGMIAAILSIFFVALFTAFCALGMLMVGLTTISRFAYLSGLIIIMPLAILCYAFPNTNKYFNDWCKQFTCQLTYLPAATFSIYIIIMFVKVKANTALGNMQSVDLETLLTGFEAASKSTQGFTARGALNLMMTPFQTMINMTLVLAMLFYGITKSRDMGCASGKIALGWTEGLKDWATGKGFAQGKGAYGWAGSKYLSGGMDEKKQNRGNRLTNFLQRIPLVSRLTPSINNFMASANSRVGNFETEAKKMGDVQLRNALYNDDIKLDTERMAGFAKEAASRGLLSQTDQDKKVSQEKFAEFIPALRRYGLDTDILKKAPHLYGKFGLNIAKGSNGEYINKEDGKKFDGAMKDFKPEDMEGLPVEAFADPEIVSRFKSTDLEKLPKKKEHRDAFVKTFNGLEQFMGPEKFGQFITKTFSKPEADAALLPALLRNPIVVKNLTNANLKRMNGADKAEHRRAILDIVNDPEKFSDADLRKFAKDNFGKPKDIEDINPEFISDKIFFKNLINEKQIQQITKEPDTNQQIAVLKGLQSSYAEIPKDNYSPEAVQQLDALAKEIIEKKTSFAWSPIANDSETKELFTKIESSYRSRNPEEIKQAKTEDEKGWWDDDDNGNNPPSTGPQNPPTPPTGGETYKLAPQQPARSTTDPTQTKKGIDIGWAIDEVLKSGSAVNNPEYVLQEEFPEPPPLLVPMAPNQSGAPTTKSQTTPTVKIPGVNDYSNDDLASLEAATNPEFATKPAETPITPPKLNVPAHTEENKAAPVTVTNTSPNSTPAPTLPEPIRTALREERNENDNQERGNNTI